MKNTQKDYINSVNLNSSSDFPYLVLDVWDDQSYPRNPGFQVMHWHEDLQFIYVLDGRIKIKTLDTSVQVNRGSGIFINKYEHIGSTSIPNIKAKPIVDIIIGVRSFPPQREIIEELEESGYTYMQEMSVHDRLYFIKRGLKNFNVHIITFQGSVWNNDVLFRDYMTNHLEEAQEYSKLKEEILRSGVDDLLEYSKRKTDFILRIYEKM